MRNTLRYIFSLLLMVLCVAPLVACGDPGGTPPSDPPPSPPGGTLYNVNVMQPEGWDQDLCDNVVIGSITPSKTQAYAGETISLTCTLDSDYEYNFFYIDIVDDQWNAELYDVVETSFVMPESNVSVWINPKERVTLASTTYEYDETSDSYAITRFGCDKTFEVIPSTYNDGVHGTKNVTIVRSNAAGFGGGPLWSVSNCFLRLPDTLTTIEDYAFSNRSYLSIYIPNTVTTIGVGNFQHTDGEVVNKSAIDIEYVHQDREVSKSKYYKTSDDTFFTVEDITQCVLVKNWQVNHVYPSMGTTISNIFNSADSKTLGVYDVISSTNPSDDANVKIESITFAEGTRKVSSGTYSPMLKTVNVADSIEYFNFYSEVINLENINISKDNSLIHFNLETYDFPKNVQLNTYNGYYYLPSENNEHFILLDAVDDSVTTVDIHPECKIVSPIHNEINYNITSITIPSGVKGFSANVFFGEIREVNIEDGSELEYISVSSFSVPSIMFPASVKNLAGNYSGIIYFKAADATFSDRYTLKDSYYVGNLIFYDVDTVVDKPDYSYVLSNADEAYLTRASIDYSWSSIVEVDGYPIVYIGEEVFKDNIRVPSNITFSDKLRYIGKNAFMGCSNLNMRSFNVPSIEYIGEGAFGGCGFFETVYIPKGAVVENTFPAEVVIIYDDKETFLDNNCSYNYYGDPYHKDDNYMFAKYKGRPSYRDMRAFYDVKENSDYIYAIEDNEVTLIKYIASDLTVVVPTTIEGYPVTSIHTLCFSHSVARDIDMYDADPEVQLGAFYDASNLRSYKGKRYNAEMFQIPLSSTWTEQQQGIYYYPMQTTLTHMERLEVDIFRGLALSNNSSALPNTCTLVVRDTCENLRGVTASTVQIPSVTKYFGLYYGSVDSTSDEYIRVNHAELIPNTLEHLIVTGGDKIGSYYFYGCDIPRVEILGAKTIESYAFATSTCSTAILTGVETIGDRAFLDCETLTHVSFGYPYKSRHAEAFKGCESITSGEFCLANPEATFAPNIGSNMTNCKIVDTPNLDVSRLSNDVWYLIDEDTISYTNLAIKNLAFIGSAPSGLIAEYKALYSARYSTTDIPVYENAIGVSRNDQFEYMVYDGNKAHIIKSLETNYSSTIAITGFVIEAIGDYAYKESHIYSITIPSTVKIIGNYAFSDCTYMTTVTFSSNLVHIGSYAFSGCTDIGSVTLPSSLETMGTHVFSGCTSITSAAILSSKVTSIPDYTFNNCYSLESFHIPAGITSIGDYAFYYNEKLALTGLETSSVVSIGDYAFYRLPITSITFPATLRSIGEQAFATCYNVTNIQFNNGLESIGAKSFYQTAVSKVTLPNTVTTMGDQAFGNNMSLVEYEGPISSVGSLSFLHRNSNTSSITTITITGGTTIAEGCFSKFGYLKKLVFSGMWDYFYAGQYNHALYRLEYLSVPCFMGKMSDFAYDTYIINGGYFKITGKEGYTGFPMGEGSLDGDWGSFSTIDLSQCKFTEAGVDVGDSAGMMYMPSTLTKISGLISTSINIVLTSHILDYTLDVEDMWITCVFGESTTASDIDLDYLEAMGVRECYVYSREVYDALLSTIYTPYLYYEEGVTTTEPDINYWYIDQTNYSIRKEYFQ